jgi:hypothetical protein
MRHVCGKCLVEMRQGRKRLEVVNYKRVGTMTAQGGMSYEWVRDGTKQVSTTIYQCTVCGQFVYYTTHGVAKK